MPKICMSGPNLKELHQGKTSIRPCNIFLNDNNNNNEDIFIAVNYFQKYA